MSDSHLGGKRIGILRLLIWGTILGTAFVFWISVGAALFAWIS
jgi:hypothetical protein